jgi:Type II secretion system (T2SS), protein E, N-terminal domain
MRKEVASLPTFERTSGTFSYTAVNSLQDVVATMRFLTTTRTEPCGLVKIILQFSHKRNRPTKQEIPEAQSACYFLENLRSLVRKTDHILLLHTVMYFVLPGANLQGAHIVQERLWEALVWRVHNIEAGILSPSSIGSGYSAYPEPYTDLAQCIMAAGINSLDFQIAGAEPEDTGDDELPALARKLGIPYLDLLPRKLPREVRQLVRPELALELHCYPLGRERDTLTVAIADPQDSQMFDRLRKETGLRIFPVLAHPQELQLVLSQLV